MPALIKRVHGTADSIDAIIADFHKDHGEAAGVSRMAVKRTLNDTAFVVRETRAPYPSQRRFVQPDVLAEHGLEDTPLPAAPPPVAKSKAAVVKTKTAGKSKPKAKKVADQGGAQATLLSAFKPLSA
jgi:hypothetical protein